MNSFHVQGHALGKTLLVIAQMPQLTLSATGGEFVACQTLAEAEVYTSSAS